MPEEQGKTEKLVYLLGAIYGDESFTKDKEIFFGVTDFEFIKNGNEKTKAHFYVCIWSYKDLNKFNELIGFVIKRKQILLEKAIKSYKKIQTRWKIKDYKKVINLRNIAGFGAYKIRQELLSEGIEVPQPTIESWIYGRVKITENTRGGANKMVERTKVEDNVILVGRNS